MMKLKAQRNNELADQMLFDEVDAEEFQRLLTEQLSEYISKEIDYQIAKLKQKGEVMVKKYIKRPIPIQAVQFTGDNGVWIQQNFCPKFDTSAMKIETMQGNMAVKVEDYVIRGIRGQFYCCDKDIFHESYDQI